MKKVMYALILLLVVVSGLVFATRQLPQEPSKPMAPTPLSAAEKKSALEEWEATPPGIAYKKWETSPAGKKVYVAEAKIRQHLRDATNMEAVVTSLTLPAGARLGLGVMARIDGDDYIVTFDAEKQQLKELQSLKVNDRLLIKSRHVSHAPKYAYPIVSCESAERVSKVIFKRIPKKDGC